MPQRRVLGTSVSGVVNRKLEAFFRRLGLLCGRYPWVFIAVSISIALVAASGVTRMEMESDYFALWYPRKSQAWADWTFQKDRFGSDKRVQSVVWEATDGSILEKAKLLEVIRLHETFTNTSLWQRVCERAWEGGPCRVRSLTNAWDNDARALDRDDDVLGTLSAVPLWDPVLLQPMALDTLAAKRGRVPRASREALTRSRRASGPRAFERRAPQVRRRQGRVGASLAERLLRGRRPELGQVYEGHVALRAALHRRVPRRSARRRRRLLRRVELLQGAERRRD